MRSEQQMLDLILETARRDERIRLVVMQGSRANPNAPRDVFQDYDIVYFVTDTSPYRRNLEWIERFGELMILQLPDDMHDVPLPDDQGFAYLMQFTDGNRIDLSIFPLDKVRERCRDSQTTVLLDKDNLLGDFPPASDRDYLPNPPSAREFHDCCNEFFWCAPYVAKGLWRREPLYAHAMLEVVREELLKMLRWHIGLRTDFKVAPGKLGKYFHKFLEPDLWDMLKQAYPALEPEAVWESLFSMIVLFRRVAIPLAGHFGLEYPAADDQRVTAHLKHVRKLPREAKEIYP